ncbi:hypothetical protein [Bartonella sp. HY406]|uniref:hypothetical protein n=1 Tax=Bartonella sp. HY406 TaxID=2979331 RepID=UPI0021CAC5B3|nr:hypothetical protein [Bartonella sp. HY406]UXN03286.1 hypothetical protein N6B01_12700 [Bartonella sp. HY406]
MAMDPYEFVPKQSVGLFRLGSSRKENEGLSNIYGDITFENDVSDNVDAFNMANNLLATTGLEIEGLDEIQSHYLAQSQKKQMPMHQIEYESGIDLLYIDEKLFEISAYSHFDQLHFNNHLVFIKEPKAIVKQLCAFVDELPLVHEVDIYFPNNHITLWQFTNGQFANGKLSWTNKGSQSIDEKSFTLYAGPRNNDQDYQQYGIYNPI